MGQYDRASVFAASERRAIPTTVGCAGRSGWSALARGLRWAISSVGPMQLPARPDGLAKAGMLDQHTLADIGLAADAIPDAFAAGLWPSPAWHDPAFASGLRRAPTDTDA